MTLKQSQQHFFFQLVDDFLPHAEYRENVPPFGARIVLTTMGAVAAMIVLLWAVTRRCLD